PFISIVPLPVKTLFSVIVAGDAGLSVPEVVLMMNLPLFVIGTDPNCALEALAAASPLPNWKVPLGLMTILLAALVVAALGRIAPSLVKTSFPPSIVVVPV